jgi:hypothetical protein
LPWPVEIVSQLFLDFEQFRTIRVADDGAKQADFSGKNGNRPNAAACLLTETGGNNIREND